MKFTFTGTGTSQGVPVIACGCKVCQSTDPRDKRLRTSGVLSSGDTTLVFDTGPDFRQQMLANRVQEVHAIVFTHKHKDHTAGLDDVRAFNYHLRRPMKIYANQDTITHLHKEYYYIFENQDYPGIPKLLLEEIFSDCSFQVGDINLLPIPVMHGGLEVLGFRVRDFAYVTDAKLIPPSSMKLLEGLDALVLNALRIKPHHSHLTLSEALEVIAQLSPRRAYLTHISHLLGKHEEIARQLPDNVFLAYDGLQLSWED
ncbi:MAG: MBL fold metallo-hydrolase [Bacteroidota bacterium]